MPDMLVKLYDLPDHSDLLAKLKADGVTVRPALSAEKSAVTNWVTKAFNRVWADECEKGILNTPVSTFLAVENGKLLGFSCYDASYRNFFGPTAVDKSARGRGIGKALLWIALRAMVEQGYAYAIIGGVGPIEFYNKFAGATVIEGSTPGIYDGVIKGE